jgi:hypothetical protein
MPDADIAAMKAILREIQGDLAWFAEQLIELRKEVDADPGRLNGHEPHMNKSVVKPQQERTKTYVDAVCRTV